MPASAFTTAGAGVASQAPGICAGISCPVLTCPVSEQEEPSLAGIAGQHADSDASSEATRANQVGCCKRCRAGYQPTSEDLQNAVQVAEDQQHERDYLAGVLFGVVQRMGVHCPTKGPGDTANACNYGIGPGQRIPDEEELLD